MEGRRKQNQHQAGRALGRRVARTKPDFVISVPRQKESLPARLLVVQFEDSRLILLLEVESPTIQYSRVEQQ
jgi:hypothetical protein